MSSTTVRPKAETAYAESRGRGMLLYAAVLLGVLGFFNLLNGISAVAGAHIFVPGAHYVIGTFLAWGWATLIFGALQIAAAAGVMSGNQLARWFAIAVVGLNAVEQMFFLAAYPFWSLVIIAVDVVALYALSVYGGRPAAEA